MLSTIVLTVAFFGILMAMMAVGLMFQGKRLSGSCGGDPDSAHCGCSPEKKAKCREEHEMQAADDDEDEFPVEAGLRPLGRSASSPHEL